MKKHSHCDKNQEYRRLHKNTTKTEQLTDVDTEMNQMLEFSDEGFEATV